jgi:hypothetical protein
LSLILKYFFFFLAVVGIKSRALHILGKWFTTECTSLALVFFFFWDRILLCSSS